MASFLVGNKALRGDEPGNGGVSTMGVRDTT